MVRLGGCCAAAPRRPASYHWEGWSDQLLFQTIAAVMPDARPVLRRLVDLGGTGTCDEFREHFIGRPERPMPQGQIGGKLTSIRAVRRGIGPNNKTNVLELDDRVRVYRIELALLDGLKRAFALADARPDLPRQPAPEDVREAADIPLDARARTTPSAVTAQVQRLGEVSAARAGFSA